MPEISENVTRVYYTRWGTFRLEVDGEIIERIDFPERGTPEWDRWCAVDDELKAAWQAVGVDDSKRDFGWIFERKATASDRLIGGDLAFARKSRRADAGAE
jgi:hypothetical protein